MMNTNKLYSNFFQERGVVSTQGLDIMSAFLIQCLRPSEDEGWRDWVGGSCVGELAES